MYVSHLGSSVYEMVFLEKIEKWRLNIRRSYIYNYSLSVHLVGFYTNITELALFDTMVHDSGSYFNFW